ncbi:hypothetical protein GCM10022199_09020 [Marihabitans asiaticum]|uniref:Uncharacterized protein n=1 Tax=Marihabitans asiaticum TaxID=415218 RepID=A0A560WH95_9MICO|nr:hypothetical protein [Marihabitans asiaticum]TWD16930.1 hypothetical protein FB557_0476 [Marihabitans asiaticum]
MSAPDGEGRGRRERVPSEFDDAFRAKGESRRVERPASSRWTQDAPSTGFWDPRGPTPEARRDAHERDLRLVGGGGGWARGLLLVLLAAQLTFAFMRTGVASPAPWGIAWLLGNAVLASSLLRRHRREILGGDPEQPLEQWLERSRRRMRAVLGPWLTVLNALSVVAAGVAATWVDRGFVWVAVAAAALVSTAAWWCRTGAVSE